MAETHVARDFLVAAAFFNARSKSFGSSPYLQPTAERRRSGSHYTPRTLTSPIVQHALEPAFERIGAKASPELVLALKVLDPACGSGAFLVEACRQLGKRWMARALCFCRADVRSDT
jgi:hypothetical protein